MALVKLNAKLLKNKDVWVVIGGAAAAITAVSVLSGNKGSASSGNLWGSPGDYAGGPAGAAAPAAAPPPSDGGPAHIPSSWTPPAEPFPAYTPPPVISPPAQQAPPFWPQEPQPPTPQPQPVTSPGAPPAGIPSEGPIK